MRLSSLAMAAVLALPALAHADIPPPPGYVEQCTISNYNSASRECHACQTHRGNPGDYCGIKLGKGYQYACKTSGATAWWEIWCLTVNAGKPKPGATKPDAAKPDAGKPDAAKPDAATVDTDLSARAGVDEGVDAGDRPGSGALTTFGSDTAKAPGKDTSSDGGCAALGAGYLPLPALLVLAGWLANRRRHPR